MVGDSNPTVSAVNMKYYPIEQNPRHTYHLYTFLNTEMGNLPIVESNGCPSLNHDMMGFSCACVCSENGMVTVQVRWTGFPACTVTAYWFR